MTPSPEVRLNEYLAAEWGYEGEVTADRPLALRRLGDRLALLGDSVVPVAPVMLELSAPRQLSHAVGLQLERDSGEG